LSILFGLLAAVFYGAADFCGGFATKRSDMYAVTATSQASGLVLLLVLLPVLGGHFTQQALLYGAIGGICGAGGVLLLYHALSIGKMGVVSPITAVLAAAVPVVAGFALGDRLTVWQIFGIAIALVSVVLISLSTEPDGRFEFSTAGVREAIASGVLLGAYLLFLSLAGENAGAYPLLFARVASVVVLALCAAALRRPVIPARGSVAIVLVTGVIERVKRKLDVWSTL
jgi:uncharacterized membrane protein